MSLVPMLLGILAVLEPAAAEVPGASLEWSAPPGCPSADEVRGEIAGLLDDGKGLGEPITVDARVVAEREGYTLRLVLETRSGRDAREIHDASCERLGHATALVVATLMDPVAVSDHIDRLERTAAETPPPVVPPTLPEPPSMPAEPTGPVGEPSPPATTPAKSNSPDDPPRSLERRLPFRPALRLEGSIGSAALPRLDGRLALAAALTTSRLRLELGASHAFAQPRTHPVLADVGLRVRLTTGIVRGCGVPSRGAWEFPLCIAGDVGLMSARGEGSAVRNATLERSFYAAALAEAHVVWRATDRFGVWVGAQGVLNLTRPSFTVDTQDPFFTASAGGGRAKLGLEVRFP